MARGRKLSHEEAAERISAPHGYLLLSDYDRKDKKVIVKCIKHNHAQDALPANLWKGMMISCCAREANSARMKEAMRGSRNHFFGRSHTIATREKISNAKLARPNHMRGNPRPEYLTAALLLAITGVPRSSATKAKLSAHMSNRYRIFEYCVRKAACGKTAGKQGIFYIVKIGVELKFGSATTTMQYRLTRLRQTHGPGVELQMYCLVDNAGGYEASMMHAYKEHWIHGEYFKNFMDSSNAPNVA